MKRFMRTMETQNGGVGSSPTSGTKVSAVGSSRQRKPVVWMPYHIEKSTFFRIEGVHNYGKGYYRR